MKRKPTKQLEHCHCSHATATPGWVGKRRKGAGLSGRGGANHGNPFTRVGACVHSELQRTTSGGRRRRGARNVARLRVA